MTDAPKPMTPQALREQAYAALVQSRGLCPPRIGFVERSLRRLAALGSAMLLRERIARRPGLFQWLHPRARLCRALLVLVGVSLAHSLPSLCTHTLGAALALWLCRIRPKEVLDAGL
jgi:hypothetical protein